jgi:recombination protein RecT
MMAKTATQARPQGGNGGGQLTVQQQREREVVNFTAMVDALAPNMAEAAAKGVDIPKLRRMVLTAINRSHDLLECSQKSWISALMQCAQDGLMPDGREAAFVKFANEVTYMPMVYGLRKKILQSGEIRDVFTAVVFEREFTEGLFEVELGTNPRIVHKPLLGKGERGDMIAAYSVATFKDGTRSFEVMTGAEIERVRMISKTGKKNEGPWKDWPGEMWRKTVLRRHAKSLPMSSDLRDVEAEAMFGDAFNRALQQRDEDRQLSRDGRTMQLPASETRAQMDDIERRAGANVDVPHDPATGEVRDEGSEGSGASTDKEERTDQGVDWNAWLTRFRDELPKITNKAALEKWKKPEGIPEDHLNDARILINQRIEQLEKAEKKAAPEPEIHSEDQPTPEPDEPTDEQVKAADELVDVFQSCELMMDLRAAETKHEPTIAALPASEQSRVRSAIEAQREKLSQKPRG